MKKQTDHSKPEAKRAFTLLELMVAIVILVIAMSIAFEAFSGAVRGWKRGTEVADGIKHGDFAMGQLVAALNSTIYFYNARKVYAFRFEKNTASGLPSDTLSFVTASGAFMPADSPYAKGPHRIKLFIDDDDYGNPALFALPMPAIADEEEFEQQFRAEPLIVSRAISGLEIQFWDTQAEQWTEEWETDNAVPERILIRMYVASDDEREEPIVFTRLVEIPVFKSVAERLASPSKAAASTTQGGNTPAPNRR